MPFAIAPLFFLAMPLIEIAAFIIVGSQIGVLPTIGLTIATSVLGAVLLRVQGFGILSRMRTTMEAGGTPGRDLVHGLMVMVAGVLLILPGFVTDAIGLLLFIPAVRDLGWQFLKRRIVVVGGTAGGASTGGWRRQRGPNTIDLDEDEYTKEPGPDDRKRFLKDDR
ncbi:FxsA family protein [Mesorhizobium sp. CAU 1732]|uniref:FxsA family protein n=1 Tax=Mesorhizobium sp. CAU 1732 TaxID=3140358 RepID=UPI0032604910